MDDLIIKETKESLGIHLNARDGKISLTGNSYPENTFELYKPMMEWVEEYFNGNAQEHTRVDMEIIYFNSSSSRLLYEFFDILNEARDRYGIEVNWIYEEENDSAEEMGEDFTEEFPELKINMVTK